MKSLNDIRHSYSLTMYDNIEKNSHQMAKSAAVLCFLHLIEIKATEFTGLGLSIKIADSLVIYGPAALVFLYYLYGSVVPFLYAPSLDVVFNKRVRFRQSIQALKASNPKFRHNRLKSQVKTNLVVSTIFLIPYYLAICLLIIVAILFAVSDVWKFVEYVGSRPSTLTYMNDLADALF